MQNKELNGGDFAHKNSIYEISAFSRDVTWHTIWESRSGVLPLTLRACFIMFFIALSVLQRGDTVAFSEYMDKISRRMKTGMLGNLFHRELGMQ